MCPCKINEDCTNLKKYDNILLMNYLNLLKLSKPYKSKLQKQKKYESVFYYKYLL